MGKTEKKHIRVQELGNEDRKECHKRCGVHIRPDTDYNLEVHRSALNLILIMRSNYTF